LSQVIVRVCIDGPPILDGLNRGIRRTAFVIGFDLRRERPLWLFFFVDLEAGKHPIRSAFDVKSHGNAQAQGIGFRLLPAVRIEDMEGPHIGRGSKFHCPQNAGSHGHAIARLVVVARERHRIEAGLCNLFIRSKSADFHLHHRFASIS
jgi:hypothetical protein